MISPERLGIKSPNAGIPISLIILSSKAYLLSIAAWVRAVAPGGIKNCFKDLSIVYAWAGDAMCS